MLLLEAVPARMLSDLHISRCGGLKHNMKRPEEVPNMQARNASARDESKNQWLAQSTHSVGRAWSSETPESMGTHGRVPFPFSTENLQ